MQNQKIPAIHNIYILQKHASPVPSLHTCTRVHPHPTHTERERGSKTKATIWKRERERAYANTPPLRHPLMKGPTPSRKIRIQLAPGISRFKCNDKKNPAKIDDTPHMEQEGMVVGVGRGSSTPAWDGTLHGKIHSGMKAPKENSGACGGGVPVQPWVWVHGMAALTLKLCTNHSFYENSKGIWF